MVFLWTESHPSIHLSIQPSNNSDVYPGWGLGGWYTLNGDFYSYDQLRILFARDTLN